MQARLSGAAESDDEDAAAAAEDSDDEDIRTIDDLAASVGVQPDDDASSSSSAEAASSSASASAGAAEVSEDEAEKLARWQAMAANLGNVDQELKETVEAIEQALMKGTGASGGGDSAGSRRGLRRRVGRAHMPAVGQLTCAKRLGGSHANHQSGRVHCFIVPVQLQSHRLTQPRWLALACRRPAVAA